MSKVKSAICLVLMTLLVAGLCLICFVSFPVSDISTFNSILTMTEKDADLGMAYGGKDDGSERYLGGGYSVVYYPEGVISAEEYEATLGGKENEADKTKYAEKYGKVGSLYFEKDKIKLEDGKPNETFAADFQNAAELVTERYERLYKEDIRVSVLDDYTIRVFAPTSYVSCFTYFSYTDDLVIKSGSGSDASSATQIMPATERKDDVIGDYVKSAGTRSGMNGISAVTIDLTEKGRAALLSATEAATEEASVTIFFMVGENTILRMGTSQPLDESSLTISSETMTEMEAKTSAILIDTTLNSVSTDLTFKIADQTAYHAQYGENALMMLYIVYAALTLVMLVFFFVRYRLLAFAHLYTYLLFVCASVLCVWAIPFLTLSAETFTAFLLTSVLLCISDAVTFENVRKEYALGKTMTSSVKTGYKKCLWKIFDLHIVLALIGFFTFFVALPPFSSFAFVFGLTAVFSGLGALIVNRFNWAILMAYTPKKGAFCNFKREEVEDE